MPYPEIQPYSTGFLPVSHGHTIYWEISGFEKGIPIVFVHGGPGGCTEPRHRQFFNPKKYKIILFDQRGGGKSTPHASLEHNTTWDLVDDMEALRIHLKIDRWVIFGGSWGSTLALCYAIKYPKNVLSLTLRGVFLGRPEDINWFYQYGANQLFPDIWERFCDPIPQHERGNMLQAYYKRLNSSDAAIRRKAATAWFLWESASMGILWEAREPQEGAETEHAEKLARIECHYFLNRLFLSSDDYLLENIHKIRHIPCVVIQGRYDIPCPVKQAWDLHKAWPEAHFHIITGAGHSSSEPAVFEALVKATDELEFDS